MVYRVFWSQDKVQLSKSFNCMKLGDDLAFQKATEFRQNKIKELNQIGYNYEERHGK